MKLSTLTIIAIVIVYIHSCYGTMATGILTQETVTSNTIARSALNYASDEQSYTSGKGGITFSYPTGLFNIAPVIQISLKQNIAHSTTQTYTVEVVTNGINSTTVMVYCINAGVVSEATTDSVTVCLFAIADPA